PELVEHAVAAARIRPLHVQVLAAQQSAGAALQASVGRQRDITVLALGVARSRTAPGARRRLALVAADVRVLDRDVRTAFVDPLAILEKFFFGLDCHRKALMSLIASPNSPKRGRFSTKSRLICRSF